MRAAVLNTVGGPFEIEEVELAAPIGREVLVRVKASGLCHSDLHLADNPMGMPLPLLLGHEIAGIVEAVGPDVQEFAVGDHVVGCLVSHCGHCTQCISGHSYRCRNQGAVRRPAGGAPRITRDGQPVLQGLDVGGFAEEVLVHENNLVTVPKEMPFDKAAVLGCGVVTGIGAVKNTAGVRIGDTVAVIGAGGVGLSAIQGAALVGARRVIAIDLQDEKLELARRFGATDVINGSQVDVVQAVRAATGGLGVDYAFEVIGLVPTALQAVDILALGGEALLIGVQKPEAMMQLNLLGQLLFSQRSIRGVFMGSTTFKLDIPLYADLYLQGRLNLDDLVGSTIRLEDINESYDEMRAGRQAGRAVITL